MSSCRIAVKVSPNASRDEVVGRLGEAWKIRIQAPPVEGKANERLCLFLARTLGLSRRSVLVVAGASAGRKIIRIEGLSEEQVQAKLNGSEFLFNPP